MPGAVVVCMGWCVCGCMSACCCGRICVVVFVGVCEDICVCPSVFVPV